MADNHRIVSGTGADPLAACDEITYSGDVAKLQLMRAVAMRGVEGSRTAGGTFTYHVVSAASANAANIKASPGLIYGLDVFNKAAYPIYVKFHDTAGVPTPGAGVVRTCGVQAGVSRRIEFPCGSDFATGIGITIVKDIADNGTTAVAAGDGVVDVDWT